MGVTLCKTSELVADNTEHSSTSLQHRHSHHEENSDNTGSINDSASCCEAQHETCETVQVDNENDITSDGARSEFVCSMGGELDIQSLPTIESPLLHPVHHSDTFVSDGCHPTESAVVAPFCLSTCCASEEESSHQLRPISEISSTLLLHSSITPTCNGSCSTTRQRTVTFEDSAVVVVGMDSDVSEATARLLLLNGDADEDDNISVQAQTSTSSMDEIRVKRYHDKDRCLVEVGAARLVPVVEQHSPMITRRTQKKLVTFPPGSYSCPEFTSSFIAEVEYSENDEDDYDGELEFCRILS